MSSRRRSNRSLRRYAASTRFLLTCARASSQTSRGASEHSAAQSRKLERKPCGTAPMPSSRRSFESARDEAGDVWRMGIPARSDIGSEMLRATGQCMRSTRSRKRSLGITGTMLVAIERDDRRAGHGESSPPAPACQEQMACPVLFGHAPAEALCEVGRSGRLNGVTRESGYSAKSCD